METLIDRRGYVLKSGHKLPESFIEEIKEELTASPKENGYSASRKFRLYKKDKHNNLILPKHYGLKKLGLPTINLLKSNPPNPPSIKFNGKLRRNQIEPTKAMLTAFSTTKGGVLSLSTGMGKTALSLYFVAKLRKKTLVIVNRVELIKQWKGECLNFLPQARVGEIQGNIRNTADCDVVIAMVNTLSMQKFPPRFFNQFDFLIVDECHTIASEIFHSCLPKIITPYTLGLSATPFRNDGLFDVITHYLGKVVFQSSNKINSELGVITNIYRYKGKPKYTEELTTANAKPNTAKMCNNIASDPDRTYIITHLIYSLPLDREILVLADRKFLLKSLQKRLARCNIDAGLFIGGMTSEELETSKTKRVILGSYQICGTGFNLPKLNTVLLATPRKNIDQMVGRILRKQHPIHPLVIDIADEFSIYKFMTRARVNYYKSANNLTHFTHKIETTTDIPPLITKLPDKKTTIKEPTLPPLPKFIPKK